ncbi:prepilin-type N-terminal cleavage/methylation domain-containing protein [Thiomicrorhabdus indica]|uniref:type II secretion system protein n=1 Tax=Thiomicrorhabdus indica TaxID=2267253 RepID=UPI002AA5F007|nr:prepilin-type N-terminal cleavage/methylation domain-containing protein [Thiomicrorhabdus indica]
MKQRGFSLLELSIAIVILGVILYGIKLSQSSIREFDSHKVNKLLMDDARQVLLTFVQVNGFLPCPDTDTPADGRENRKNDDSDNSQACVRHYGGLPYLDLGISDKDEWWSGLYYSVNQDTDNEAAGLDDIANPNASASYFSNRFTPNSGFDFNTPPIGVLGGPRRGNGNFVICNAATASCDGSTPNDDIIEHAAIAVVVSYGDNGNAPRSPSETENTDNDDYFWQARRNISSGQEFDDQLFWLTGYDVKYAIIRSEKGLPDMPVPSP